MTTPTAIETLLRKFAAGDATLLAHMSADIDFRIDHFQDDEDVSWQSGQGLAAMGPILQRLAEEVFPQGTKAKRIVCTPLDQTGWVMTTFEQEFFYGVRNCLCNSITYIISHEADGQVDFFRETVTNVMPLQK